jgi:hypothetical protein
MPAHLQARTGLFKALSAALTIAIGSSFVMATGLVMGTSRMDGRFDWLGIRMAARR